MDTKHQRTISRYCSKKKLLCSLVTPSFELSQLKIMLVCILKFYLPAVDNPDEHTEESNMLKLKLVQQLI